MPSMDSLCISVDNEHLILQTVQIQFITDVTSPR